jgi:hypothetical protein
MGQALGRSKRWRALVATLALQVTVPHFFCQDATNKTSQNLLTTSKRKTHIIDIHVEIHSYGLFHTFAAHRSKQHHLRGTTASSKFSSMAPKPDDGKMLQKA